MIDEIYVPRFEAVGSVLGFVPVKYPQGLALLEIWDIEVQGVVKVTCLVSDIHELECDVTDIEVFHGRDAMIRATADLVGKAKI